MVIYGDTVETLSSNHGDNQPSHKERLPNSVQVQLFKIMISPQGLICTSAGQPQLPYLKKLLALQSIGTCGLTAGLMMSSVSHIYIYIYIPEIYSPYLIPIYLPNIQQGASKLSLVFASHPPPSVWQIPGIWQRIHPGSDRHSSRKPFTLSPHGYGMV